MREICKKENCSGCAACYNICKHNAIKMQEDDYGFLHPLIDSNLCVDCGLCEKICPSNSMPQLFYPQSCYAAVLNNEEQLLQSASGGAATAFMSEIIDNGGVVYGCTGEDIYNVRHIRIDSIQDITRLRGSKYVQSAINDSYRKILSDLKNGKKVLFIGTPCQIAGLKSFVRIEYENLITIDLVCHGVPSQKMLSENINYYIKNSHKSGIKLEFRKKYISQNQNNAKLTYKIKYGWFLKNNDSNLVISKKSYEDSYMFGFLNCLTFRDSCYSCRYATSARISDITIADFWGLGDDVPIEQGKGVSACMINTSKGNVFFQSSSKRMNIYRRDIVEAIIGNGQLQCPSRKHKNHTLFRKLYLTNGLKESVNKSLSKELIKIKVITPIKEALKKMI